MIDMISRRYLYFLLSVLVIVPGLVILATQGLPLSIDFTGGSLLEVQYEQGKTPQPAEVVVLYETAGIDDAQVQTTENGTLLIRSSFLDNEQRDGIISAMETDSGSSVAVIRRITPVGALPLDVWRISAASRVIADNASRRSFSGARMSGPPPARRDTCAWRKRSPVASSLSKSARCRQYNWLTAHAEMEGFGSDRTRLATSALPSFLSCVASALRAATNSGGASLNSASNSRSSCPATLLSPAPLPT